MYKKNILLTFLMLLTLFSCKKEPKSNDEFRTLVLNRMNMQKDTLQVFNAFLNQLDSKNTSFGDYYVKSTVTILDSVDKVLAAKYEPDYFIYNNRTEEDSEFLYKITVDAHQKYYKKLEIDTSKLYQIEYTTNSSPEIKRYLNNKYNLGLYIPEDEAQDAVGD